ncbi:MAG TPA: nucleotidyltransferase family protein [Verrucomicrobiae bacterium]|jgi:molybdenum cofactor cytidylyltransferase|nr:nucleotidyltransferase family protein [Verrucomicrobiae bacterium]
MSERPCVGVILAAGASSRLQQPKQLVEIDGETLLRRTVRIAAESGCHRVVVVLGFAVGRMRGELEGLDAIAVVNERWRAGMGSSMRCGVEAALQINPRPENILLLVCDQFRLTADFLRGLIRVHGCPEYPIAAARYNGRLGVPAVFSSIFFPNLLAVSEEHGARRILERNAEHVAPVDFPDGELDLDTPEDLKRLTHFKIASIL